MGIAPVAHLVDHIIRLEGFLRVLHPVDHILAGGMADILAHVGVEGKLAVEHVIHAVHLQHGARTAVDAGLVFIVEVQMILRADAGPALAQEEKPIFTLIVERNDVAARAIGGCVEDFLLAHMPVLLY